MTDYEKRISDNLDYVEKLAARHHKKARPGTDLDVLQSAAYGALMEAAEEWENSGLEGNFRGYLTTAVSRAFIKALTPKGEDALDRAGPLPAEEIKDTSSSAGDSQRAEDEFLETVPRRCRKVARLLLHGYGDGDGQKEARMSRWQWDRCKEELGDMLAWVRRPGSRGAARQAGREAA